MNSFDRGMIKWMPFNSVVSSKQIIKEINLQKSQIKMPTLSYEQNMENEQKIIQAYHNKDIITIIYYSKGSLSNITGTIKKIDSIYHKIYLNNNIIIFDQIVKIIQS